MTENEITYKIRGAIFKVYNALGPGLLESVYEAAMCYQMRKDGLSVASQVNVPIVYDGTALDANLRLDILVENMVIVELKSVKSLEDIHHKQLLTYLRLSGKRIGILVNFNTDDILSEIHRKINGYVPK